MWISWGYEFTKEWIRIILQLLGLALAPSTVGKAYTLLFPFIKPVSVLQLLLFSSNYPAFTSRNILTHPLYILVIIRKT